MNDSMNLVPFFQKKLFKKEKFFMKLITKEWLNRAKDDLDVVEEIFDNENLTNMVAFHS